MTVHAAIPTVYRGIQMRSRLEAKWACVFDQLGWTWEYEPFDLNGWIPDFLVTNAECPFLIEVKPLHKRDEALEKELSSILGHPFVGETTEDDLEILPKHYDYDALIVGAHPFWNAQNEFCIGWLSDCDFGDWYGAPILTPLGPNRPFGLSSGIEGIWQDRFGGEGGKETLRRRCGEDVLRGYCATASNATQWKRPR